MRIPDGPGGSGEPPRDATGLGGSGDGCRVVRMMFSLGLWAGSRLAAVSGAAGWEAGSRATSCGGQHHAAAGASSLTFYRVTI